MKLATKAAFLTGLLLGQFFAYGMVTIKGLPERPHQMASAPVNVVATSEPSTPSIHQMLAQLPAAKGTPAGPKRRDEVAMLIEGIEP